MRQPQVINPAQLQFPVVTISRRGTIEVAHDVNGFSRCGKVALKNGFFVNAHVIDSHGRHFVVRNPYS
jgi:hypothetical protein